MKYIILNDISYILKNKLGIIITYIVVLAGLNYLLLDYILIDQRAIDYYRDGVVFATNIYLKENLNDIFQFRFIVLNYGLYLYLALLLFLKDINNCDNLFMRIKTSKWITCKIISNILIAFIINTIIYLIVLSFKAVDFIFYFVIIKKVFVIVFMEMFMYFIVLVVKKYKFLFFLGCLLLLEFCMLDLSIANTSIVYILLLCTIFKLLLDVTCKIVKFSDLKG